MQSFARRFFYLQKRLRPAFLVPKLNGETHLVS
jgi:hypothetical protein